MNCRSVLLRLDGLPPAAWDDLEPALALHLEQCGKCRALIRRRVCFDNRLRRLLRESSLPAHVDLIQEQQAVLQSLLARDDTIVTRAKWSRRLAVAVCLCLAASWLIWQSLRPRTVPYTEVTSALVSRFLESGRDEVGRLVSFDGSFPLQRAFRQFQRLHLSEAHGIDLDGDEHQDAAIFRFTMERWQGVLAVLPTQRMSGVPAGMAWVLVAGRPLLQWQSEDHELTYLCLLKQGPMQGLADELMSNRRRG